MVDIAIYLASIFMGFRHVEGILKLSTDTGETAYNLLGFVLMVVTLIAYYQRNHKDSNGGLYN